MAPAGADGPRLGEVVGALTPDGGRAPPVAADDSRVFPVTEPLGVEDADEAADAVPDTAAGDCDADDVADRPPLPLLTELGSCTGRKGVDTRRASFSSPDLGVAGCSPVRLRTDYTQGEVT